MTIPVVCPSCAAKMQAPENLAGRKSRCPTCGTCFTVPVPGEGVIEPSRRPAPLAVRAVRLPARSLASVKHEETPSTNKATRASGLMLGLCIAGAGALALSVAIVVSAVLLSGKGRDAGQVGVVVTDTKPVPDAEAEARAEAARKAEEDRQREAVTKAEATRKAEEDLRRQAEEERHRKAEAEAARKALILAEAAERLVSLKAKLPAAQQEVERARMLAEEARKEVGPALEEAERDARGAAPRASPSIRPGPAGFADAAEASRNLQMHINAQAKAEQSKNRVKELAEKARAMAEAARQAAASLAELKLAIRDAEAFFYSLGGTSAEEKAAEDRAAKMKAAQEKAKKLLEKFGK